MKIRYLLEWAALELLVWSTHRVSLDRAQAAGEWIARHAFERSGRRAAFTLRNLEIAYPELSDEERRAIGRSSYVHVAWNLIDWARATQWTPEDIRARVEIKGLEHVHSALGRGRGAFAVGLHLGAFELAAKAVPLAGIPLSAVGRTVANRPLYRRAIAERARTGTEPIDRRNGARAMLRALRENRLVAVLNDQYSRRTRGVLAPLFGARCSTSAGVATLALRTGAPVLSFHTWRDAPDHHLLEFGPPIETPRTGDRKADVEAATAEYNKVLESFIRAHPDQWVWAHRRFRHSPDLPDLEY